MKFFALSIDKIILRYFLMMAAVIVGVFTGTYWLAGLALPIFLSAILGVSFSISAPEPKQVRGKSISKVDTNALLHGKAA